MYVVLSRLNSSADVFLLKMLKGDAAVGYYSAAFRLIYPLSFIPAAIVMSLFPLMSRYYQNSKEKLVKSFAFGTKLLILIGFGLALSITFLHRRLIAFLYTEKYLSSSLPLMILMWAELFIFLNFFLVDFNNAVNQQRRNTYAAMFMFLINVALNIALIPKLGVMGASYAKLATVVLGFSILYFYAVQKIAFSLWPIIKRMLPIAGCFLIYLFFIYRLNLVLIIISSPVILALFAIIFRFFSETERKALKAVFGKVQCRV